MIHGLRGRAAVAALLCALLPALAPPALADSSTFALTSAWQKIASAGQSVDVQNNNGGGFAVLSTAVGGAPVATTGQALGPGEHRLYNLGADLYALGTVPIIVTGGFTIPGSSPAIASNAPSVAAAGSLSASGSTVALTVDGMNTATVQLVSGGWAGTIVVEVSADSGTTWIGANVIPYPGGTATGSLTAGGLWEMAVGGLTTVRLRASTAITSGPVAAVLRATNGIKSVRVGAPDGNPLPTKAGAIVITSTEVAVPAATSTSLLAANSARRFLSLTNDGVNPCRVQYGTTATATGGEPLAAAAAANGQGGGRTFDASAVTQQAVAAFCASASSFAVLEGQ